mgnify:FL=1
MGIQTTLNIKRSEAEEKFVNKLLEDQKIMFKKAVKLLSDEELGNNIDETFYNYTIIQDKD